MFELEEEESKIAKLGPRDEKHGDSDVLAVDVYVHVLMPNTALAMFAPRLRSSLYFRRDTTQGELVDDGHLPDVLFPEIKSIPWTLSIKDAKLTVHHGTKRGRDMVFEGCTLDRFNFEPRKNGQVMIRFRAQVHPTEEDGARLLAILGKVVKLSIADGDEDENYSQATLDGMDEDDPNESDVVDPEFTPGEQNDPDAGDGSLFMDDEKRVDEGDGPAVSEGSAACDDGAEEKSSSSHAGRRAKKATKTSAPDAWPFPGGPHHPDSPAAKAATVEPEKKRGRRPRAAAVE